MAPPWRSTMALHMWKYFFYVRLESSFLHGAPCGRVSSALQMEPNFHHGAPMVLFHGAFLVEFLFNVRMDTISSLTLLKGMALPWRGRGAPITPAWCGHGAPNAPPWRERGAFVALHHAICFFTCSSAMFIGVSWRPTMRMMFHVAAPLWSWSLHGVPLCFLSGR